MIRSDIRGVLTVNSCVQILGECKCNLGENTSFEKGGNTSFEKGGNAKNTEKFSD